MKLKKKIAATSRKPRTTCHPPAQLLSIARDRYNRPNSRVIGESPAPYSLRRNAAVYIVFWISRSPIGANRRPN